MIATVPINLTRSDGLPSDRWRLWFVDHMSGTVKALCDCKAAHANERDAEFCQHAVKNAEMLLASHFGVY